MFRSIPGAGLHLSVQVDAQAGVVWSQTRTAGGVRRIERNRHQRGGGGMNGVLVVCITFWHGYPMPGVQQQQQNTTTEYFVTSQQSHTFQVQPQLFFFFVLHLVSHSIFIHGGATKVDRADKNSTTNRNKTKQNNNSHSHVHHAGSL